MLRATLDTWQFRLSHNVTPDARMIGGLALESGPGLGVIAVWDGAGRSVGVLLGFPFDIAGRRMLSGSWHAPETLGDDVDAFVERVLESLGEHFLWIFATPPDHPTQVARIYMDTAAQVPCVFDPEAQVVASTAHALFDDEEYDRRLDRTLFNRLGVMGQGWFPAGLTAHRGLSRILPNHYLDLETWTTHRHWPHCDIRVTEDPQATVAEICRIVVDELEALVKEPRRAVLALTAGRETRMILACARPLLDKVEFVTVTGGDRHTTDTVMARRIARELQLRYRELPRVSARQDQTAAYIRRGGHCNGDTNSLYHPSVWPIANDHIFVGGFGGEIGRAFFWKPGDQPDTPLSADNLVNRLGLPTLPELTSVMADWLKGVPTTNTLTILDLAYIEHRMGPWSGVQFYCDPTLLRLAPLVNRRCATLMMSLPPEWKRSGRMIDEALRQAWPELARYPFNSLGPARDLANKLQQVIRSPKIILKKLRKLQS